MELSANASPAGPSGHRRAVVAAVALALLFVVEFVLFDRFGAHQITAIYPRWNDQIQYLSECYTGYEYVRTHGLAAGLWHTLVNPSAQGTLHDFAALILFQFVGASRSAALALNMLALIAWQAALWYAVSRRSGSHAVALLAAMLPLALHGPWENVPGSAYDFRLDHLATCAFGICSAFAVLTNRLETRRWSVGFGAAAGIVLLTRFLTGTYFVVIFVALLGWALAGNRRATRVPNLLLATATATIIAGPILWLNREWVWNYYYVGHYVGPESAIRNQNFGLIRSTEFVWSWLAERHLGRFFAGFVGVTTLGMGVLRVLLPRPVGRPGSGDRSTDILVLGALFAAAPALVLTLHPQKSEVVLGALVPGVALVVVGAWLAISGGIETSTRTARVVASTLTTAAVVAVVVYFAQRQLRPLEDPARIADLRQVNTLADYVFTRSEQARLARPRVAVDNVTDALDAQVIRVICYERHHVWKDFDMRLPTGIAAPESTLVRERIAESDFVFLNGDDAPIGPFPFDRKLAAMRPELRAWCDAHLRVAKRVLLGGHAVVLYARPELTHD